MHKYSSEPTNDRSYQWGSSDLISAVRPGNFTCHSGRRKLVIFISGERGSGVVPARPDTR